MSGYDLATLKSKKKSRYHPKIDFYRMPDHLFGMTKPFAIGRRPMEFGQKHMIDFLLRLNDLWSKSFYDHLDEQGNFAEIPLWDITVEGGAPSRAVLSAEKFGHSSHRTGLDVDLHYIAKDGVARINVTHKESRFDALRTEALGKAILQTAGKDLELLIYGGGMLRTTITAKAAAVGGTGQLKFDAGTVHDNHFHVRLKKR